MEIDTSSRIGYVSVDQEMYDDMTSRYSCWAEGPGGAVFNVEPTLSDAIDNEDPAIIALLGSANCDDIVFYVE